MSVYVGELGHSCFGQWLVAYSVPRLNQVWLFICQLVSKGYISRKYFKFECFHSSKWIWKCLLNGDQLVTNLMFSGVEYDIDVQRTFAVSHSYILTKEKPRRLTIANLTVSVHTTKTNIHQIVVSNGIDARKTSACLQSEWGNYSNIVSMSGNDMKYFKWICFYSQYI